MDNMAYLNQISAETRPTKKPGGFLGLSPVKIGLLIGGVVLAVLLIVVTFAGNGKKTNPELDLIERLNLRTGNIVKTLKDYNKKVKSSDLRSKGSALSSVLTETNINVQNILKEEFGIKSVKKSSNEEVNTSETEHLEGLNKTLEDAWLNGALDRIYVHELATQISYVINIENDTLLKTKNTKVKEALNQSLNNLRPLYDQFYNYSGN